MLVALSFKAQMMELTLPIFGLLMPVFMKDGTLMISMMVVNHHSISIASRALPLAHAALVKLSSMELNQSTAMILNTHAHLN